MFMGFATALSIAFFVLSRIGNRPALDAQDRASSGLEATGIVLACVGLMIAALLVSTALNWTAVKVFTHDPATALIAYLPGLGMMLAVHLEAWRGNLRAFLRWYMRCMLAILAFYTAGLVAGVEDLFFFHRFVGLSENPNQVALQMLITLVVALSLLLKLRDQSDAERNICVAVALLSILIGLASDSEAFRISLAATLSLLGGYWFVKGLARGKHVAAGLSLIAVPLMLALPVLMYENVFSAWNAAIETLQYGNQDLDRFALWLNGIEAWLDRPFFGQGVGGWSGNSGPFEGREAHNSFIDWLSIGGITGTIFYLAILTIPLRRPSPEMLTSYAMLLSIVAFTLFHFVFRMPPFWLALLAIHLRPGFTGVIAAQPSFAPWRGQTSQLSPAPA